MSRHLSAACQLLADFESNAALRDRLGPAGDIYRYMVTHVGDLGLTMARSEPLIGATGRSLAEIEADLHRLEDAGLVRVLSRLPFLAIRLSAWPGSGASDHEKQQQLSSNQRSLHMEVPVSSRAAAAATQEDGGAGEGEVLLADVLATLGPDADRDEFRSVIAGHSPELIRRCLVRVRSTKAIRVSRAALFRSLLHKLSK